MKNFWFIFCVFFLTIISIFLFVCAVIIMIKESFFVGVFIAFLSIFLFYLGCNFYDNHKYDYISQKKSSYERIKKRAGVSDSDILDVSQHFQEMFIKYGIHFSDEKIAEIISEFAQTEENEAQQLGFLMSCIPKEIDLETFRKESLYHIKKITKNFLSKDLENYILNSIENDIASLSEEDIKEAISIQQDNCPNDQRKYFRYNFELTACVLILSALQEQYKFCSLSQKYEVIKASKKIFEFAKNNGYSMAS